MEMKLKGLLFVISGSLWTLFSFDLLCMIPEKQAVTKAKEAILSPLWGAAAFQVAKQQVLKVSVHGVAKFWKAETLKMPKEKK